MKIRTRNLFLAISLFLPGTLHAATLYWDASDTSANADGGTGTWSASNVWDTAATAGTNATFNANDSAVFGGVAGTVTSVAVTSAATTFSTTGYTLNLTATVAATYALGTLTGDPTINVTLGNNTAGSLTASFGASTNFSGFTGILNVGTTTQTAGTTGKAQISSTAGPLPAGATVNVRTNSTLFASTALTHLAPITLNGGDMGESLGQLRLEGGANWGGTVTLAGDSVTTLDNMIGSGTGAVGTISGNMVESGGSRTLTKGGTGIITLSGTNSFTGPTIVRVGTIGLDYTTNNTNKLSSTAAVTLGGSAALRFTGNASAPTSQTINGLTLTGVNASIALDTQTGQTLTADFSGAGSGVYSGGYFGLAVNTSGGGTAQLRLPGTVANSPLPGVFFNSSFAATDASNYVTSASTVVNQSNLALWTSGNTQYSTTGSDFTNSVGPSVAIDGITFSDNAARTVTIGSGNTLTLARGVIVQPGVGAFNTTVTGGTIKAASGAALEIAQYNTTPNAIFTIGSTIADNAGSSLMKLGGGILVLSSANSYTGGTSINGGLVRLGNIGAFGSGPVTVNTTGASIFDLTLLSGSQTLSNNIVLTNPPPNSNSIGVLLAPSAANVVELSGQISGGGPDTTLRFNFSGTFPNAGVNYILSGNNTYAGKTYFYDGGVRINHGNAFGTSTVTFDQSANTPFVFGSSMTVPNAIIYNYQTIRMDTGGNNVLLSGPQTFTAPIEKIGSGKLTLGAANTGTSAFTVSAGTLALGASGTLLNTPISIASGAAFDVTAVSGGFTIASGKTLVAGDSNAASDVVGDLVLASGGVINPAGDAATGTLAVDGNLSLNGGTLRLSGLGDQIALSGVGRTLTLSGTNTVTSTTAVLSPGTYTIASGYTSVTGNASNFSYTSNTVRGGSHSFDVGATATTLTVSGSPSSLTWSGASASTVWDVNTTANWNSNAEKFYQLDGVTFADSPLNSTVTINGTVVPGSIAFTNATTAYIVRGGTTPVIGGSGSLTKSGAAMVTMWHPNNTYSGGTTINAGTLNLNFNATVSTGSYTPLGTGLVTIHSTGTWQINPSNGGAKTVTFPNAVRLNGGTLFADDGITVINGVVTVDAASTVRTQFAGKTLTLAGGLAGSGALTVTDQSGAYGNGTVALTKANDYSGTLTINNAGGANGSVTLSHASALQNAKVQLNTTAADDGYGTPPSSSGLVLAGAAGTNFTIAGLSGTQSAARVHNNNDVNTRTLTVNQSTDSVFAGGIGGTIANTQRLNLVKSGSGTLTLAGTDTYTGNTTVSGGKLVLKTRNSPAMVLNVADGAALGVDSSGVSLYIKQMNLGTSGATNLEITNFPASESLAVIDCEDVANNATTTIRVAGTFVTGRFPLVTSLYGRTGSGTFVLAPLPRGVNGSLDDSNANTVDLVINSIDRLTWTGGSSAVWNINDAANWKLGAVNPEKYQENDNVLFDGTGANRDVTLDVVVSPFSLAFSGSASHSISGIGSIAGATGIVKDGSGQLTLGTANTFTGSVALYGGTTVLTNSSALGSLASGTTVAVGATLDLNGQAVGGENITLSGSLVNQGAGAASLGGAVDLNGAASIGGSGNLGLSGSITGSYDLEKIGAGKLTLTQQSAAYTGTVTVSNGTLEIAAFRSLEKAPIVIGNGGTVNVTASNGFQHHSQPVTVKSGGTLAITGATSNIGPSGSFTMEGGSTLSAVTPDTYWGSWTINNTGGVSGSALLAVAGGSPVAATISASLVTSSQSVFNLNVADVTASAAADLVVSGSFGSPSNNGFSLQVNGGGKVLLNGVNTYTGTTTVESGSALGGTGSLAGPLTVAGTLAPGLDGLIGAFTTKAATLTGTYQCQVDATTADVIHATGNLTLTGSTLDITGTPVADGYVIATYTGTRTGQFATVNGMTSGYTVVYDDVNKQVKVAKSGYATWAATNAPTGTAVDDFDGDGVSNAVEYVLGGSGTANDLGKLPKVATSGGNMTFTFTRNKDSIADTTVAIQLDGDMVNWPLSGADYYPVPVGAVSANPGVTVIDDSPANTQTIILTVPLSSVERKFGRLEVKVN